MARLVARDLAVTPPGATRPVVEGLSIDLGPGEWVALGGANGSGKTSVLLALAGLWPASAGTLTLDGEPFGPGSRRGRAGVAAVLQDPSSQLLQPTVREELAFGALNQGAPPAEVGRRVAEWAGRLSLDGELDRDPRVLSAGGQQLVLIASALVMTPAVLCADEAIVHVDPPSRRRVVAVLREEATRGLSILWVTQDPAEAAAAHRLVTLGELAPADPVASAVEREPAGPGPVVRIGIAVGEPASGPRVSTPRRLRIELRGGDIVGLEGPNGAGKSVVLAAVAGLEPSPQVEVDWGLERSAPPIVALQYPELQIFEEVVEEEIVFAATARGLGRGEALERATRGIAALGLEPDPFLRRRTWQLSTGEKRLVEVVAALIAPASLVLLDEPSAGIDPERRSRLGRMIRERARSTPILIASQDRAWLASVASRVVTLGDVTEWYRSSPV